MNYSYLSRTILQRENILVAPYAIPLDEVCVSFEYQSLYMKTKGVKQMHQYHLKFMYQFDIKTML